ncbi:hypothetical protein AJ79_08328 [Helicocarpus griseus UAMH5409]|uniref:Uncharacterized protein n=1 Tax=Helicocarpus griseus UAMH5409 TaxID=1447875 RepID=A0A2B7WU30_9EURO|nr:hypothetical protein AJ79_08328 [Helicocarpus griseus UAMH5409]
MERSAVFLKRVRESGKADVVHTRMSHLEQMMGSLVYRLPDRNPQPSMPDYPTASARGPSATDQEPLPSGFINFSEVEALCGKYRQMSQKHFPCVLVPKGLSVLEL